MTSESITSQTKLMRLEGFITSPMGKELAMMSVQANKYFALDDIGKIIWEMLEKPITMGVICDRLVERFEVSRQQCEIDVKKFLEELIAADIIKTMDNDH